jgi:hypothetical protein
MRAALLLGMLALTGCSALPVDGDGVVALEIRTPSPVSLRQGEQLILRARALNLQGDSVPSLIRWRTADTAAIVLDSLSGVVEARVGTGTARVQAAVGTLRSDPLTITLLPAPTPPGLRTPR